MHGCGLLIESRALAQRLAAAFDTIVPKEAYEVRAGSDRRLEWIFREPAGEIRYDTEPGSGPLRRLWIHFLSVLPIDLITSPYRGVSKLHSAIQSSSPLVRSPGYHVG